MKLSSFAALIFIAVIAIAGIYIVFSGSLSGPKESPLVGKVTPNSLMDPVIDELKEEINGLSNLVGYEVNDYLRIKDYEKPVLYGGKVFIWDTTLDAEAIEIESKLRADLFATSPNEKMTIMLILNGKTSNEYANKYIVGIYWPEKVVAFTMYSNREIDSSYLNEYLANRIGGLPVSYIIPPYGEFYQMDEKLKLLNEHYNTLGYSNYSDVTSIQGNILLWDSEKTFVSQGIATFDKLISGKALVPYDRVAQITDSEFTVMAVAEQELVESGQYLNGLKAIKIYLNVYVVDFPSMEVIGFHRVEGNSPPFQITEMLQSWGDVDKPFSDWVWNSIGREIPEDL